VGEYVCGGGKAKRNYLHAYFHLWMEGGRGEKMGGELSPPKA